jgi:hypothetical protein
MAAIKATERMLNLVIMKERGNGRLSSTETRVSGMFPAPEVHT